MTKAEKHAEIMQLTDRMKTETEQNMTTKNQAAWLRDAERLVELLR